MQSWISPLRKKKKDNLSWSLPCLNGHWSVLPLCLAFALRKSTLSLSLTLTLLASGTPPSSFKLWKKNMAECYTEFVPLFEKQISRTFQGLFQDSKVHTNPFTRKISMLILLTVCHTFYIFNWSLTDFQNFPGPVAFFQHFPVLENATTKSQDFPGFPGTRTNPGYIRDYEQSEYALRMHVRGTSHPQLFAALETRTNTARNSSRSRLWDRYIGHMAYLRSHEPLREETSPRFLLVSKAANVL